MNSIEQRQQDMQEAFELFEKVKRDNNWSKEQLIQEIHRIAEEEKRNGRIKFLCILKRFIGN